MVEYRIVTKLDPAGVTSGAAKVKQDLQGIDAAAGSTSRSLATIASKSTALAAGNTAVAGSLDKIAAAGGRAGDGLSKVGKGSQDAARGAAGMEAATRRVLQAVDSEAAELMRLNRLLADAKMLHERGAITANQYARVQLLVSQGVKQANQSNAAQRAGYQQLGFQVNDVVTSLASGASPMMVFAQQASQLGQALQLMSSGGAKAASSAVHDLGNVVEEAEDAVESAKNTSNTLTSALARETAAHEAVAGGASADAKATSASTTAHAEATVAVNASATASGRSAAGNLADAAAADVNAASTGVLARAKMAMIAFMSGPWSAAVIAGVVILGTLAAKLFTTAESVEDLVKKMKKEEEQSDKTREAKERFKHTEEGVAKAIRESTEARKKSIEQQGTEAEQANIAAKNNLREEITIRNRTKARLDEARVLLTIQRQRATGPSQSSEIAALGLPGKQAELDALATRLAQEDQRIYDAEQELLATRADLAAEAAKRAVDPVARLNRQYDEEVRAAQAAAKATGQVTTALTKQITVIEERRKAALKAAQADTRGDGVARFTSRQQAVGIAGRELQQGGLRVGENEQFGGVTANHPGMGNKAHGQYAIDVNSGVGITESNVPDLKQRFDELARRYQARGYEVIWNGQFYAANGDGPTRAASGHRDHLHIQAPQTIVGKATQSSTEAAAMAEFQREATAAEQQRDFVQGVVDQAATRGQGNRGSTLGAQVTRTLSDFERRFNRAANDNEKKAITDALTEADMREARVHFEETYIQPLERLRALQDKTGVEREILNAKLNESQRLGRELSAEEAANIEDLYHAQSAEQFDATFVKPLERMRDLQGKVGVDREVLNAQLEESIRIGRELNPVEMDQVENSVRQTSALQLQADILAEIKQPQLDYAARIEALNALLEKGTITQTAYNARVSELGQSARDAISDMPGSDPATGQSYGDLAARAEEEARFAQELDTFESHKSQLLQLGIDYDALVEAAHRRHVQNMNNIDMARRTMALTAAQSVAESLTSIAEMALGKQSGVYKALFAVSKAFAIAQASIAMYQNIAEAMKYGFPQNLPFIAAAAAQGALIISSLTAIKANFAAGGYVSGAGGPRDDRIAANLSNGEYVVNAEATSRHRALLEAVNSGNLTAHMRRRAANDTAAASAAGGGNSYSLSFGDVVVNTKGGVDNPREVGREVKAALVGIVREEIAEAGRDGGALTRTRSSVMAA